MKKYSLNYSRTAIRDLDRIWSEVFNASHDYDVTEKYIDELLVTIESKTAIPKSGNPLYYENMFTGYYYVLFKTYIAFYRINDENMLADRVLYGAGDYMRELGFHHA